MQVSLLLLTQLHHNPNKMSDNFKEELKIYAVMYNNTVNDIMIKHGKEAPYPQKDFGHDDGRKKTG